MDLREIQGFEFELWRCRWRIITTFATQRAWNRRWRICSLLGLGCLRASPDSARRFVVRGARTTHPCIQSPCAPSWAARWGTAPTTSSIWRISSGFAADSSAFRRGTARGPPTLPTLWLRTRPSWQLILGSPPPPNSRMVSWKHPLSVPSQSPKKKKKKKTQWQG